jgi:hypothetical protein
MKKNLLLSIAALLIAGNCHAQKPRYAASTQTWKFGNQVWSDAIQISGCDKSDFINSNTTPACRSLTFAGLKWYYYNWAYVEKNQNSLCPAPWRVPSKCDIEELIGHYESKSVIKKWGYTGYVDAGEMKYLEDFAGVWSISKDSNSYSFALINEKGSISVEYKYRELGFQVRCVR